MKIITKITLLSFFVLILNGCSSHNISKIKDNGEWVDIQSAPLTCGYILHDNKIYGIPFDDVEAYDEERFWIEDIGMTKLLDMADPATFKVNIKEKDEQPYAKDKNHVYCPENLSYLEFEEGTSCPYSETYVGRIVIPGADPDTFKYLGDGYAVDKNNMYKYGRIITWDDEIINSYQHK